jgi:DNA-binding transcriptional MerR regulator
MLKIGEFSRVCQVPVSALRYYADIGLLPPAQVDPLTGYRFYALEQLPQHAERRQPRALPAARGHP